MILHNADRTATFHCFSVAGEYIPRVDANGDGVVIKSEWRKFIDNLRATTGIAWRLPTSAEWEYAAKGGNLSKGTTYSGSNTISEVAWFSGNSSKYVHDGALKKQTNLEYMICLEIMQN